MNAPIQPPIHVTEGGREALERFDKEMAVYCRELPRLVADGEEGRYVIIRGNDICGTWDTYRDASQHGLHLSGERDFSIHKINRRDEEPLKTLLLQEGFCLLTGEKTDANTSSAVTP